MIPQGQVKIIGNYSYNLKHCLGEGAYGKVYQGQDTGNGNKVAIKKLDLRNFEKDTYLRNQIISEIEILKKFNHTNIVKFIDLISTQRSLYIITEFCKDGDLREIMARKKFNENEAWKILKQIAAGFKELVTNAIIHRDLKPANILSHEGIYKIADFGFAKYVDNFANQLLRSCVGSPLYMAPQILARKPYSTKCDIWSLGIIYYEMIFQDVPWKGRDERDLLKNILSLPLAFKKSVSISSRTEEFLKKSLTIEETERISWDKVFEIFEIGGQVNENAKFYSQPSNVQYQSSSSSQTRENNRKKSIFNQQSAAPQVASLQSRHNEIIFRNFVLCTELLQKYQTIRAIVNSNNLNLEKLMICLSKCNLTIQTNLMQQTPQSALKKEFDYYVQTHNEIVDLLSRNGQLVHCERDLEISTIKDGTIVLNDAEIDKFQSLINQFIKNIRYISLYHLSLYLSQEIIDEVKKNHTLYTRSTMLTIDNLLDIIHVHKKILRAQDVDFSQLNELKADEDDVRKLSDKVNEKYRSI